MRLAALPCLSCSLSERRAVGLVCQFQSWQARAMFQSRGCFIGLVGLADEVRVKRAEPDPAGFACLGGRVLLDCLPAFVVW